MKVIKPLNRELTHEDVGKKIADIGEVCEEEGCIFCIPVEDEKYSYNIEDYTPKVKPGKWEKIAHGYRYKDTYGNMLAVVYFRNGSYVAESCAEGFSTGRTKLFPNEDSAKTYVEEQYRKYVLSLIEVEE